MRILQLVTRRQRRGAEVFAIQLSDALATRGHEVIVLGLVPPSDNALTPNVALAEDLWVHSDGKLNVRRLSQLGSAIRRIKPDVVQANGSQTLKYGSLAKRMLDSDYPLVYRNISIASQWVRGSAHRAWGRWLVRSLDHVTSVSEESSRDFGEVYRVPAESRSVIRRGLHIPETVDPSDARKSLQLLTGASADALILVHTGNYSEEKNHGWLLETFQEIRSQRPDVHLVLIGEGELLPAIRARVEQLGLGECVHILGMRPDAAELVAGADLFVLPSRIEGIPGVVLEAAAQGVPTVATNVGGMAEAIVEGTTGLLIDLGDRTAFVTAVLSLLADEARRKEMGAAARRFVREHFSMEVTASAFEDLYTRMISEQRR